MSSCPSTAGSYCDPRSPNCPTGYECSLAEICTRTCEQDSDCWIKVTAGCRYNELPGQRLPDGGTFVESSDDGYCPDTKALRCFASPGIDALHCQLPQLPFCAEGGACDYDIYGPSPSKGNRDQGPAN